MKQIAPFPPYYSLINNTKAEKCLTLHIHLYVSRTLDNKTAVTISIVEVEVVLI